MFRAKIALFVLFCFLFSVPVAIAQDFNVLKGTAPFEEKGSFDVEEKSVRESDATKAGRIITTTETIYLGGPGCYDGYRWFDDDVNTWFFCPDYPGCKLLSATLSVRFCDADFYDQSAFTAELDVVQFGVGSIDVLKGYNNQFNNMSWNVVSQILSNNEDTIPFVINVDAVHNSNWWAVTIHWAKLVTVWWCEDAISVIDEIK